MEIANLLAPPQRDDAVTRRETLTFSPYSAGNLSRGDEIRIAIQNQSAFNHIHESYLYIEGKITTLNNATNNRITMVKNWLMHLFDEIKIELSGKNLDSIKNPGVATTLHHLVSMSKNEQEQASEFAWQDNLTLGLNESFSYSYALKKLLPVARDYKRLMIFSKLELVLVRSRTDVNCVVGQATTNVAITLSKVQWKVPNVDLQDPLKLRLLKVLENGKTIPIAFRQIELLEYPFLPARNTSVNWN